VTRSSLLPAGSHPHDAFGEEFLRTPARTSSGNSVEFPLDLPDDDRGIAAGSRYDTFLRAGYGHAGSTGFCFYSPKFRREIQCQSSIEAALSKILHLNPYLVDFREHYVIAGMDELRDAMRAGDRIRNTKTPTIDAVATFSAAPVGERLAYRGFSVKSSTALAKKEVLKRLAKDELFCVDHGWYWSLYTEKDVDPVAHATAKRVLDWAKGKPVPAATAYVFAREIVQRSVAAPLDSLLFDAASCVDLQGKEPSAVLAQAVLNGYLILNSAEPLRGDRPLSLKRP
jgi:hypothetical protein